MDNTFQSPNVLSFCPGNLGIERAIEGLIGHINVLAYVEIEAYIIANLVAGMEAGILGPAPIWTDATTFNASPFYKKIHWIIGGYPCPGESLAGLREGHLYKGFIWPSIRRAIAAARPLCCFFENVDDHLTGTYPIVLRSLHNMGYAVEAGIYSAGEVGATHERKRIFIFAMANGYRHELRRKYREIPCPTKTNERTSREQDWQRVWDEFGYGGTAMADPHRSGSAAGHKSAGRKKGADTTGSSDRSKLAHANRSGQQEQRDGRQQEGAQNPGTGLPGAEMGDTGSLGQHRHLSDSGGSGQAEGTQTGGATDRTDPEVTRWPAGQGEFQYDWEAERTIKPGVGCTVNGYNFKEDILRSLGNMVVSQSAQKAFVELYFKLIYG